MPYQNQSGTLTHKYVSALDHVHKRGIFNRLYQRDREDSIFDSLITLGRMIPTSTTVYGHHEAGSIFENIKIDTITSISATEVTFTLTTATGSVYGTAQDGYHSYPLKGNQVRFVCGAQGVITVANKPVNNTTHTFTVQAVNGNAFNSFVDTANGNAPKVAASEMAIVFGTAFAEGTDQPDGRISNTEYWANQLQIAKGAFEVTGSADTEEIEFTIKGQPYFSLKGALDTELRFRAEITMAFLLSDLSDGTAIDPETGLPIRTTKGLVCSVRDHGWSHTATGGVATIENVIDPAIRKINKMRGHNEYMFLMGMDMKMDLDADIQSLGSAYQGIRYTSFGQKDGKQVAEMLGFDAFGKNGYSFHGKREDLFNHDKLAGTTGFNFTKTGIMIPMDYKKDPKTGEEMPAFACKYKEGNGQNRWFKVWEEGSNAKVPTNGKDVRKLNFRSEFGAHFMGLPQYGMINIAA